MLAEGAWRLLMRALWAAGRPSEALRAYFELRDHLAGELGADPSRETSALYMQILQDDEGERRVGRLDAREEVKMLMSLLRQAVASIPGLEEPRSNRALAEMAAQLAA
jgi:DNA-binding SARP family transcriptional activator